MALSCNTDLRQYVVDTNVLMKNICCLRNLHPDTKIWAVVKGNGYGIGISQMVRMFTECGIRDFCVADLTEAQSIRNSGFQDARILMLQPSQNPKLLKSLAELNVICTVSSLEDAWSLNETAQELGIRREVHVKVDTGMGRYGFGIDNIDQIATVCTAMPNLKVTGIYTHFAFSGASKRRTFRQYHSFVRVIEKLKSQNIQPGEAHCCNSAAFLRWPEMSMDSVRIGSAWLGRMPLARKMGLEPIGYCECLIAELHHLHRGQTTGYCGAWKAHRDTTLAMIPVGWYHGFGIGYNRDPLLTTWTNKEKFCYAMLDVAKRIGV